MATPAQMGQGAQGQGEEVHRHSGWLLPLVVFVITAALSALILLYYLAPSPISFIEARPSPTTSTAPVHVTVGTLELVVPADYILYPAARRDGARKDLALIAALPDFRGYSTAEAQLFADHSAQSPVLNILVREEHVNLPASERLRRIYLGYVTDPRGAPGPFGLTEYAFRDDNGYRGQDMFVAEFGGKTVVMRCWRFAADNPSPDCLRDQVFAPDVAVSYRFKRANLEQWREIASGVAQLVTGFVQRAK